MRPEIPVPCHEAMQWLWPELSCKQNKRLLVELTLIQCAQLTLPDADDASGGRGPKKILKPLFTQQAASTAATQPQPQAKTAAAQTAATAAPQPQGTSTAGSMNASRPSPLPQTREEKKSRCSRRAHSVYPCAVLCTNSKPWRSKKQKRQAPLPKTMPHTKIIFSMKRSGLLLAWICSRPAQGREG